METEVKADGRKPEGLFSAKTSGPLVFISNSSQDNAVAEAICADLERDGIRCWLSPRDVMAGGLHNGRITEAFRSAQVLIFI